LTSSIPCILLIQVQMQRPLYGFHTLVVRTYRRREGGPCQPRASRVHLHCTARLHAAAVLPIMAPLSFGIRLFPLQIILFCRGLPLDIGYSCRMNVYRYYYRLTVDIDTRARSATLADNVL